MGFTALAHAVLALLVAAPGPAQSLSPQAQARLVVVSGVPAPPGAGGVFVRAGGLPPGGLAPGDRVLAFADQEGGLVSAFPDLPPAVAASAYTSPAAAYSAGRETGAALSRAGVDVDLAPVLDAADGPLGSREFRRAALGIAFLRGLLASGEAGCVKHFPGLGTAPVSTDEDPHVHARLRPLEVRGFARAVRAGAPCVMVGHAFYAAFGRRRASVEPAAYRLLRRLGFRGVAITDSVDVAGSAYAVSWARRAILAGADLVLVTNPNDARRVSRALVPFARRGLLREAVAHVLAFRARLGLPPA